jgi:sulfur relay (sulfurtransferase) complex TusBCD TusD component (DsrE family)
MRYNGLNYSLTVLAAVAMLLALTVTFSGITQESTFAQPSSDRASMSMNTTTTPLGSKMDSLGRGIPVLVHITAGNDTSPYEVHSAQMGVDHALSMLRNGKDVAIILDANGVNIAAKNVTGQLQPISGMLEIFLNEGGRVIACDHCVSMAGLTNQDLKPGVEIDAHPEMPRMQRLIDQGAAILDY